MALQKAISLDNGIVLNYHRVLGLNIITNKVNIIEVNSYINEDERNKEKRYQELQKKKQDGEELTEEEQEELAKGINVLIEADYVSTDYNENMTIEDAYDYLKTTDKYKDAIDV